MCKRDRRKKKKKRTRKRGLDESFCVRVWLGPTDCHIVKKAKCVTLNQTTEGAAEGSNRLKSNYWCYTQSKEANGNHFPWSLVWSHQPPRIERTIPSDREATELIVSVLTTTPNCSGSDKLAYSFSYLAKALSCSCSGRCFTRFYREVG